MEKKVKRTEEVKTVDKKAQAKRLLLYAEGIKRIKEGKEK